jgi:hypothetical protein
MEGRAFHIKAMAFNSYHEIRVNNDAEVREGVGIVIDVRATSTNANLGVFLGAVANQVEAGLANAQYDIGAKGSVNYVASVNAKLPPPAGKFDAEMWKRFEEIVKTVLPDSICPSNPSLPVVPGFAQIEFPIETYPDYTRLIVFAFEQLAFGSSFEAAYKKATQYFGPTVDPRPLEYVFQSLGCNDLSSQSTPESSQDLAHNWINEVDIHITSLVKKLDK